MTQQSWLGATDSAGGEDAVPGIGGPAAGRPRGRRASRPGLIRAGTARRIAASARESRGKGLAGGDGTAGFQISLCLLLLRALCHGAVSWRFTGERCLDRLVLEWPVLIPHG